MSDTTTENTTTDVFSMTDESLANRYKFVKEHGVGNWGSVWLASDETTVSQVEPRGKVAIKVVHRSKTQTTAARVRALWNEMKVIRSFKEECHPSLVWFKEFIITPSYALIVMEFLPKLVPVPAAETQAKTWFESLASAVHFLHKHGVVHNDIKPANILLSNDSVPKLVDFGFSESHNQSAPEAFYSSLAYGTPEYLSPERARGQLHDSRKSDVWSLGVTFFEIIMGRTPFESDRGEQFLSKEELDVYWRRTYKGKWLISSNENVRKRMSKPLESLLRRMLAPNADVRATAAQIIVDPYWSSQDHGRLICPSDSEVPTKRLSNAVRSTLSSRINTQNTARGPVTKGRASNGYSSGKENQPLKPRSASLRQMGFGANANPQVTKPAHDAQTQSSLLVAQDATRVKGVADTGIDRMAHWVKQVERVVQEAKDTISGSTSQPLPPLPTNQPLPRAYTRVNDRLASASTQPRAVGFSVDLDSPQQLHGRRALRHMASDQYPFNERAIDGTRVETRECQPHLRAVRRAKSDYEMAQPTIITTKERILRRNTPSYNKLSIDRTNIVAIPETRAEETDESTTAAATDSDATKNDGSESYYDRLLVESFVVERVGKGYQSNVCTRDDHRAHQNPPTHRPSNSQPPELKKQTSTSQFLNSVREQARPRRKMRQAASFDGIGAMRRQETPNLTRPRPVSANFEGMTTHENIMKNKEKKRSVAGTMYKALLTLVGAGEKTSRGH